MILFLDPVGTLGGAERSLLDLVASIQVAEPSLTIGLIVGGEGPLVAEAKQLGVNVQILPLPRRASRAGEQAISGLSGITKNAPALVSAGLALASYARELDRAIRAMGPVVIHSNGMKMHALAAMIPPRGARVVWHVRDFVGRRTIMAPVLRALEPRADAIVGISRSIAQDAVENLKREDVTVIYNAVDTRKFSPEGERAKLDELAGLAPSPPETLRVGLVATYARWKGQGLFVDAAARFVAQAPHVPVRFYVIGGVTYDTDASQFTKRELVDIIRSRGLSHIVGLVPFQRHPELAYRALDVAVHASTLPEPFGRTIAEGMACGTAQIIAREGGAAELGTDGVDAVPIVPRDTAALATALLSLASDPERRARLGAAARQTAIRRFSRERLGPEMLSVYRRIGAIR